MADEPTKAARDKLVFEGPDGVLAAPLIYTDWVGGYGHVGQTINITLCGHKYMSGDGAADGFAARYAVAHLRMPLATALAMKDAIEKIVLALQPPASNEKQ